MTCANRYASSQPAAGKAGREALSEYRGQSARVRGGNMTVVAIDNDIANHGRTAFRTAEILSQVKEMDVPRLHGKSAERGIFGQHLSGEPMTLLSIMTFHLETLR